MSIAEPRRVLIATLDMTTGSGTVTYTRDLALALLRHGWTPIVYSSQLGAAAAALRKATIPVVSDPAAMGAPPDVIHGHHVLETLVATARFPGVPAVFVCHDSLTWHSIPPHMPSIAAWVAVDRNCRDRAVLEHGVPADSVRVFTNAVDLERFRRRGPLPARPRRALVFSNQAVESAFVAPIRTACAEREIEVDVAGWASGHPLDRPEEVLSSYDLVFAKARCAIEAAASGAAVIGCDAQGMSGMITTERLEAMRLLNFGARTLRVPVTRETVLREIDRYDSADAALVTEAIRNSSGADLLAEQFIALYEEILDKPKRSSAEGDLAAIAHSLNRAATHLYAQMAANRRKLDPILRFLNSPLLRGPMRLAWRWRQRHKAS
jgi:hypothetical protein